MEVFCKYTLARCHLTCDGICSVILGEIKSEADHEVLGEGVVLVEDEKNTVLEANILSL